MLAGMFDPTRSASVAPPVKLSKATPLPSGGHAVAKPSGPHASSDYSALPPSGAASCAASNADAILRTAGLEPSSWAYVSITCICPLSSGIRDSNTARRAFLRAAGSSANWNTLAPSASAERYPARARASPAAAATAGDGGDSKSARIDATA